MKGSFRSIRVSRRGASPRVVSATIVGSRGTTTATGPQLRARLGLYDSWVYFNSLSTNVTPPPDEGSQTTPSGGSLRGRWCRACGPAPSSTGT